MTGAPIAPPEPSPLDTMTDEAKEAEAEKLMGLIDQLNRYIPTTWNLTNPTLTIS